MVQQAVGGGRKAAAVADALRKQIAAGTLISGAFMPSVRTLALDFRVAKVTLNRALKDLEQDGWVVAHPRHGYRVRMGAGAPDRGLPIAYLNVSRHAVGAGQDEFHQPLLLAFQRVAARRNWSQLTVATDGLSAGEVVEQVAASNARGAITNGIDRAVLQRLRALGIPTVVIDAWSLGTVTDTVLQDGPLGGMQAAVWLAERGHRRIGWAGPTTHAIQAIERWGGAVAGLHQHGLAISPEWVARNVHMRNIEEVQALLARPERPSAVIALWANVAIATARAAANLGLRLGRDLELVGWATAEEYDSYETSFPDGSVPATVIWRIETLAEIALARLAERRAHPQLPLARIILKTRLRPGKMACVAS